MKSAHLAIVFLATSSFAFAQSFTGALNPTDPNDVVLVTFTLSAPTSLHVQSWGYGGSSGAPGGKNAAGQAIAAGGFDPYMSLFAGVGPAATFVASNDDGLCPPGTATGVYCLDSTLHVNSLPAGTYTLALSVFENFSFEENLGTGTLGDLFIGLGNYYDTVSNSVRTSNYAFDIAASGLTVGSTTHIYEAPVISKSFGRGNIVVNGTTTLTFTITNPGLATATGVAFADPLPAGLLVASPGVTPGVCGGTVTSNATTIAFAGGTIAGTASCQIAVVVRGAAPGIQNNATTHVSSTEGGQGNVATATILVGEPVYVRYTSNLTQGDSVINITNTGENGAPINGPGFGGPAGNICVNVYAFSPDEQLVACCSCLVTPNGLVHLTANNDLVSNTLTGIRPDSLVVKLIATGAGPDFKGSSCANSASLAGTSTFPLVGGMRAWGTTLHSASNVDPVPAGSPLSITETPFLLTTPSLSEIASITNRCTNIVGNGSTFGQCKSCRQGGLGGSKL